MPPATNGASTIVCLKLADEDIAALCVLMWVVIVEVSAFLDVKQAQP